jgi:MYXO-CTERM domain-containing protein
VLRLFCAAVGACVLLIAGPAWANGRFPASNQIIFSPSDKSLIILRASYGIMPSHDNGATWQFLCEDALGLTATTPLDPELALTHNNALVAGVTDEFRMSRPYLGLDVSPDVGCSWNCIVGPLLHQAVSDVVVRPDAPDVVLAVASTYLPMDAGGGTSSQVFQSTDDGANWSPLGRALDRLVLIQTIDVAKTDPARIYLSGTRGVGAQKTASLFVSMDTGESWTERQLPMFDPSNEEFIWIGAVDPTDPDRVYVRSSAPVLQGGKSRLYVTTDAGKSFQVLLDFPIMPLQNGVIHTGIGELLGFALSPDGSKVYAGTKEGMLFMAAKSDLNFRTMNSSVAVQCLATRGDELWACSDAKSGFIIGVSTDDGMHFCPKMKNITAVTGTIACGPNTPATVACGAKVKGSECQPLLDMFCQGEATPCQADCPASYPAECRGDSGNDGATCDSGMDEAGASSGGTGTNAGGDGGTNRTPTKSSGCGCSIAGGGAAGGLLAFSAAMVVAWRRRRAQAPLAMVVLCFTGLGSTACSKAAPEPAPAGTPMSSPMPTKLTTTQNLRSVWGSSDSDLWIVGDKGTIVHFDGRAWSDSNSGTTEDLTGIYGTAPNDIWVSTQQGSVLHWDGATWQVAVHMAQTTLLSIWASGPTDVWAVGIATTDGDAGLIRRWNGAKWETTIVPNSTSVWSVTGMGPSEIWMAGSSQNSVTGFVLRGNGSKFDAVGYAGPSCRGVWVIAPNDVWVAPYQGAMQHYDGSTWMAAPTTGGPLLRVTGSSSGEVWAVGLNGVILHYQGGSWSTPSSGTTEVLWSIWSNAPSSVWAVGNSGTVLRWNGAAWGR